jgi:hypothetical protein
MIVKAARVEVRDEGAIQGRPGVFDFTGAGVSVAVSGNVATVTVSGATGAPAWTEVEQSLGSVPDAFRSGHFTIAGAGLTANKHVQIFQAVGPYTNKGTRFDEAEMDSVSVTAKVRDATTIDVYWETRHFVRGNFKFAYLVSA